MEFRIHNQLNCDACELWIDAYLTDDPALSDAQRRAFETHLQQCPACINLASLQKKDNVAYLCRENTEVLNG